MANRCGNMLTGITFLGSKITVDSDCSHEIKRHLLLGRKAMTNLDSILKSRNITLSAAAAAKSLQSCPTLCNPIDGSPPGAPVPGILMARTLEWVAISFSNAWKWKVKVKSLSLVQLLATWWTAATRLLRPWDSPGKSTGVGCHGLLHYFVYKGPSRQSYGFSSSHAWIRELDKKNAEHRRIDSFELWCWGRFLRVPWTARDPTSQS